MTVESRVREKALLASAIKVSNRARKLWTPDADPGVLVPLFVDAMEPMARIINRVTAKKAEDEKSDLLDGFVRGSRKDGKWFYLASSHDDCAEDHIPYQGRMYVDEKAPESAIEWARQRGLYTVQWVMGAPAWFITRPNCRHYFVSLTEDEVRRKPMKRLKRKYHTHRREGDREMRTPARIAVEAYEERVRMLKGLLRERRSKRLEAELLKAEMLLRKWKERL